MKNENERITIYLPPSLTKEIEEKASALGLTRAAYIRWLLLQDMKAQKGC